MDLLSSKKSYASHHYAQPPKVLGNRSAIVELEQKGMFRSNLRFTRIRGIHYVRPTYLCLCGPSQHPDNA